MTADPTLRLTDGTPARQALVDALRPILPDGWQLLADESAADSSRRPRVRVSQRSISRGPVARWGVHVVEFTITVTVDSRDGESTAEADLDDALDAFLFTLDSLAIAWDTATKGKFGDENDRLGYSIPITVYTDTQKG